MLSRVDPGAVRGDSDGDGDSGSGSGTGGVTAPVPQAASRKGCLKASSMLMRWSGSFCSRRRTKSTVVAPCLENILPLRSGSCVR